MSDLLRLEHGLPLSSNMLWYARMKSLRHYRLNKYAFFPVVHGGGQFENEYITSITPSPDRRHVAFSSNQSFIKVYSMRKFMDPKWNAQPCNMQYDNSKTLVRNIVPELTGPPIRMWNGRTRLRIKETGWMKRGGSEFLVVAFSNAPNCFLYHAETCNNYNPCINFSLFQPVQESPHKRGCSGIELMNPLSPGPHIACATGCGIIRFFDVRTRTGPVGSIHTDLLRPKLASSDFLIAAGGLHNTIRMYDIRRMTCDTGNSLLPQTNRAKIGLLQTASCRHVGGVRSIDAITWLKQLPGTANGVFVFQTLCGRLGLVDMASGLITSFVKELEIQNWHWINNETRPRLTHPHGECFVTKEYGGKGWCLYAPKKHKGGARLIVFGISPGNSTVYCKEMFPGARVTALCGCDDLVDKLLIGGGRNEVAALTVDFTKPPTNKV